MATDATGAPTPLGIPKYNTSADAPSGLGFNAAMDAIDALLAGKVSKPAGISTGEAAVWNGSAFVRSSVTPLGPTSLGTGTPDVTKVLRGDGTWGVGGGLVVLDDLTVVGSVLATYDSNTRLGGVLPTTYKDLILVVSGRSDQAADQNLSIRINNDATANYYWERLLTNGAAPAATEGLAQSAYYGGGIPKNAGYFGHATITFPNYAATGSGVQNGGYMLDGTYVTGTATGNILRVSAGGAHATQSSITRVAIFPAAGNFQIGTRFTLYGRG